METEFQFYKRKKFCRQSSKRVTAELCPPLAQVRTPDQGRSPQRVCSPSSTTPTGFRVISALSASRWPAGLDARHLRASDLPGAQLPLCQVGPTTSIWSTASSSKFQGFLEPEIDA